MAKYMVPWTIDPAKVPTDAKERGTAWLAMIEMVKADTKKGFHKDWGAFPGEMRGYSIAECTETELVSLCLPYLPGASPCLYACHVSKVRLGGRMSRKVAIPHGTLSLLS